jgi:YHS domain-containing protein
MNRTQKMTAVAMAFVFAAAPLAGWAADSKTATKAKPYPLDVCAVSGEKFGGDMGEPYVFVFEGQEIQLCCKSCKKDFDKDSAKYMAKVGEASKKVRPYPLTTCVMSGEKLGDDAVALVYKGQEVKFCCKDCVKEFKKKPDAAMAKLQSPSK